MSGNNTKDLACPYCLEAATYTDMVECPLCLCWIHYHCAGVTDSIEHDYYWCCKYCKANCPKGQRIPVSTINTSRTAKNSVPTTAKTTNIDVKPANLPFNEYKKIIPRISSTESVSSNCLDTSIKSKVSSKSTTSNASSKSKIVLLERELDITQQELNLIRKERELLEKRKKLMDEILRLSTESFEDERVTQNLLSTGVEGNVFSEGRALNQNIQLQPFALPTSTLLPITIGPTQAQIAARHTFGSDLVKFTGKPSEWLPFITQFRESTISCGFTNNDNVLRLSKCLDGDARRMVEALLNRAENVPSILKTLEDLYGRPELLIGDMVSRVRKVDVKTDQLNTLVQFAVEVRNLSIILEEQCLEDYRRDPTLMREIIAKLPPNLKIRWAEHNSNVNHQDVVTFSNWLFPIAMSLCAKIPDESLLACNESAPVSKTTATLNFHDIRNDRGQSLKKPKIISCIKCSPASKTNAESAPLRDIAMLNFHDYSNEKCPCCENSCAHLSNCPKFAKMTFSSKWTFVKKNKFCGRCLNQHYFRTKCPYKIKPCGKNNCNKYHDPLMHNPKLNTDSQKEVTKKNCSFTIKDHTHKFRRIPVTLSFEDQKIHCHVMLDDESLSKLKKKG